MSAAKGNAIKIAINCDMGEAFGLYRMGDDEAHDAADHHRQRRLRLPCLRLQPHAHDRAAGQAARRQGRRPSFAARSSGLRPARDEDAAARSWPTASIYQIGALKGFLDAEGMTLNHIKPHGALYGMAARNRGDRPRGLRRRRRLQGAADGHGRHLAREDLYARAAIGSSRSSMPTSTIVTTAA